MNFLIDREGNQEEGGAYPVAWRGKEKKQSTRGKARGDSSTGASPAPRGASAAAAAATGAAPRGLSALRNGKSRYVRLYKKERIPKDAHDFMKVFPSFEHCTEFQYAVAKDKVTKDVVSAAVFKSVCLGDLELAFIRTREDAERKGHAQCVLAHGLFEQLCNKKRPLSRSRSPTRRGPRIRALARGAFVRSSAAASS